VVMKNLKTVPLPHYNTTDDGERLACARMFADEMGTRRTVRDFSDKAGSAPSGANQQPWHFVAISNAETKQKIRAAAEVEEKEFYERRAPDEWLQALAHLGTDDNKPFLEIAPWLIAIFYERTGPELDGHKAKRYYPHESTGIAVGLLIASLHRAGLATLTHTPSPMAFLNEILNRPKNEVPYLLLVVGHPSEDCRVPDIDRKAMSEIASFIE
jgi:iodotyrosine deiodinase